MSQSGASPKDMRGAAATPQYLACRRISRISIVRINVALLINLKESPICRQIGDAYSFSDILWLRTWPQRLVSPVLNRVSVYLTLNNVS